MFEVLIEDFVLMSNNFLIDFLKLVLVILEIVSECFGFIYGNDIFEN